MGVSIQTPGGKGRKSVDAELNLIPFIDLLSVCILFLLMTAVWVQISKMSAFTQPSGESTITHSEVSSLNEKKEDRDLDVIIKTSGVEVLENGRSLGVLSFDNFKEQATGLKNKLARYSDPKISLRAEDDVVYENVITVLDGLFSVNWTQITISGAN